MKILFIADGCHPGTQGGIQTFGRALKKMFGEDLIFLSYKVKKENILYQVENNIEVGNTSFFFRLINKLTNNYFRNILIKKEIKKIKPDVIILRSPQNLKILDNVKAKKILVQHTQLDRYFSNKYYYNKEIKLLEESKKKVDYFVVTSEYDREKLIKDFNFPKEKIKVIRHSCEIELLKSKKERNKNLIMVARLENKTKRFDLVIKAMKKLKDFKLEIYGSGKDEKYLKNLIKKENIKNVELHSHTNKVQQVLDKAGIFVITSEYEGYPIAAIEAVRRGLPLILRNSFEGSQDIVINNGILMEKEWNEDKFIEIVRKVYDNYEYYSENSKILAERYDLKVIKEIWRKSFIENETKNRKN